MSTNTSLNSDSTPDDTFARRPIGPHQFHIWLDDPNTFSPSQLRAIHHDFHLHPLMQLPQLAKLAHYLYPKKQCRFVKPGITEATPFHHQPSLPDGREIDHFFQQIEEPGSWVALYNVEAHPAYREFVADAVASVSGLVEREQPGIFSVQGFIFISAPPSVTPFHIDRENNFWLQISGRKTINVWDPKDETVVSGADRDEFIVSGDLSNVRFNEALRPLSREFNVGPGDGVYFPSTSPHMTRSDRSWVVPGDTVSISIGIVFYTDVTRYRANVHAWNLFLRRFGLKPRAPGQLAWLDRLKHPCGRALVWAKKKFRGYSPSVGL